MSRTKSTTTTTTSTTKTKKTERVKSLDPAPGKQLSSLEESVVRMHHGISVKPEATLTSNVVNKEIGEEMEEMEVDAFVETGRIDTLTPRPADGKAEKANQKTNRIVDGLKEK